MNGLIALSGVVLSVVLAVVSHSTRISRFPVKPAGLAFGRTADPSLLEAILSPGTVGAMPLFSCASGAPVGTRA